MPAKPDEQLPVSRGAREAAAEAIFYAAGGSSWTKAHKPLYRDMADAAVKALGEREPAPSTARELRAALEPFVRSCEWVEQDDMPVRVSNDHTASAWDLTWDEIQRARQAFAQEPAFDLHTDAIPQSEAGEGVMRGPNNGVNCPQCGVRLPADYSPPCPDCGTEDFIPTAQTEGSGLAEELAALLDEASTWHWNPGVFSNVREPLFYDRDDLWQRIDQLRTALSSAPAEFHMGGAAAALVITEPMQSAPADVREALECPHGGRPCE